MEILPLTSDPRSLTNCTDDVVRHVGRFGIIHGAGRKDVYLIYEEGRHTLEGGTGAVDRNTVTHGNLTRTLDIDVGSPVRQDKAGSRYGRDSGADDLGHILVIQGDDLGYGQFGNTHIGIAGLFDRKGPLPLDRGAAEDDLTLSGHVDNTADEIVGHADGNFHRSLAGHRGHRDPFLVYIGHPRAVRIDVDDLLRGGNRLEIQELLGRQDCLGQLLDRLLLASGQDAEAECHGNGKTE